MQSVRRDPGARLCVEDSETDPPRDRRLFPIPHMVKN